MSDDTSESPSARKLRQTSQNYHSDPSQGGSGGKGRAVILALVVVSAAAAAVTYFNGDRGPEDPAGKTGQSLLPETGNSQGTNHPASDATPLSTQAHAVLQKRCAQCHAVKMVVDALNVAKHSTLTDGENSYVVAGNLEDSQLWQRMGIDKDMPPEEVDPATVDEIDIVKKWIEEGAAPFPGEAVRPFIADADVWKLVLNDLEQQSVFDRPYIRYFSFVNLHNNSFVDRIGRNNTNYAGKNLPLARAALSKLVNSLSWMPDISVPQAIEDQQLVFRIDLRNFGWDESDVWRKIQRIYPYGLDLTVSPDESLRDIAEQIYELSGTKLPVIRGDWFLDTAPRAELYYDILALPGTVQQLEAQLAVDVDNDFRENRLRRAGFSESGVSRSNRLVDRHPAHDGYYWKSYDFGKSEDRGNLFKFPLGPKFADNDFHEFAFEADGGEMIFSLPNGLQGYYLADAAGKRLDAGPVEVVRDNKETSGTPAVVNAISCMACHQHGMIRFTDTVRSSRSVPIGEVRLKVDELFASADEMNSILDEDAVVFLKALQASCGEFLKVGEHADKSMEEFTEEPIGTIARYYQKDLELEDVAAELGQNDPQQLAELIKNNSRLRELGLAPLAEGAGIKRSTWASTKEQLFHSIAAELEIGTKLRIP